MTETYINAKATLKFSTRFEPDPFLGSSSLKGVALPCVPAHLSDPLSRSRPWREPIILAAATSRRFSPSSRPPLCFSSSRDSRRRRRRPWTRGRTDRRCSGSRGNGPRARTRRRFSPRPRRALPPEERVCWLGTTGANSTRSTACCSGRLVWGFCGFLLHVFMLLCLV